MYTTLSVLIVLYLTKFNGKSKKLHAAMYRS